MRRSTAVAHKSRARKPPKADPRTSAERIKAKIDKASGTAERPNDMRWWLHEEPHNTVFSIGRRIATATRARRQQDLYMACLYDDDELAALISGPGAIGNYTPQTMSTNIVKRQTDAFVAKGTKNRPIPMGLTTGGNYGQQRRAKALSKVFEGVLDEIEYWPTREIRWRDAGLFGSGFAWNYRVGRKLYHDRVFPWEIEVDPREAMYGKPRNFFLKRYVDRLELIDRFPEYEEEILASESKSDDDRWANGWEDTCDLVLLRGVWHLPSSETSGDGAFALCVSNATLGGVKEFKRPGVPFSKIDVLPGLVGYRGQGLAKSLTGIQYEANAVGMKMQEAGYMTGSYWLVEDGSDIETDVLDNGVGTVIRYRGAKPEHYTPAPWHPAFFDWYMFLRGRAPAEETRMSEQATRGEKPPGLNSGEAVRAWHQIDDEAHVPTGRADERDVIATCWQQFDLLEEIYEDGQAEDADEEARKPYVVRSEERKHGRTLVTELDYAKVRLDRKSFILRVFPTSFLTGTPAEQREAVHELIQMGFLSQDEALILLDFPDLQRVLTLRGAARRNIERLLEKYREHEGDPLLDGIYETPEPAWNLPLCKALALMGYLEAKLDGVPEPNLKAIMKFATDAEEELQRAKKNAGGGDPNAADPMAGTVDPMADPALGEPAPVPGEQFLPPDEMVPPANAVAPEAMPLLPGGP
jgi:hypothetical protein